MLVKSILQWSNQKMMNVRTKEITIGIEKKEELRETLRSRIALLLGWLSGVERRDKIAWQLIIGESCISYYQGPR